MSFPNSSTLPSIRYKEIKQLPSEVAEELRKALVCEHVRDAAELLGSSGDENTYVTVFGHEWRTTPVQFAGCYLLERSEEQPYNDNLEGVHFLLFVASVSNNGFYNLEDHAALLSFEPSAADADLTAWQATERAAHALNILMGMLEEARLGNA